MADGDATADALEAFERLVSSIDDGPAGLPNHGPGAGGFSDPLAA
ncbi:hypothetical protein [Halovivax sp.]|nr:hypothetical protein [Halovivax sp.]